MSPWASASPIRTLVTAACSCMTPPSSSGTPSMSTPSSAAWASSSAGVAAIGVGVERGGTDLLLGEGAAGLLEHLLLVVGGEVEQALRLAPGLARRFAQLLRRLEGAAGGGRRAEAVLGRPVERSLDLLADPDPVEQVGAGEAVERPQAEAHAALGDALVGVGGGHVRSSRCGLSAWPRAAYAAFEVWGSRLASRTAKAISSPSARAGELDAPRQQDRLAEARRRPRRRRAGGSRAPPGSGPWSTSRGRSRAGKPSGFAVSACMWIGLRSPETAA